MSELRITTVPGLIGGNPRLWGEGWWTAADMTLTHPRSPLQEDLRALSVHSEISEAFDARLERVFLFGG